MYFGLVNSLCNRRLYFDLNRFEELQSGGHDTNYLVSNELLPVIASSSFLFGAFVGHVILRKLILTSQRIKSYSRKACLSPKTALVRSRGI